MLKLNEKKNWLTHKFTVSTDTSIDIEIDETHYSRLGWMVMLVGVGGFVLWASFAPLDKGVPSQGTVISDGHRQTIQATHNGVLEQVLVKDGDTVKAGQVIARMNSLQASAQNTALKESIASKQRQVQLVKEQLTGLRDLARDGYMSRNKLIDAERNYAQLTSSLAEEQAKLPANEFELNNNSIKAPVDGTVANLEVYTPNAIVQAGSKIMEVVPTGAPLVVEAQIPTQLIDKVRKGLPVEIRFPAFNQAMTPNIPGRVVIVPDNSTQDNKGQPYYKVQVEVTDKGKKLLAANEIRPGMPAEVFVVTGERTLMSYLFKPVLDRAHSALREE